MNSKQFEQMDALLRVLFNEGDQAWYHVYTKAGVSKSDADWLYKTLKADGYVKTNHKGADFSIPDPHVIGMTDAGRSWFSKTNYVREFVEKPSFTASTQHINITNSHVSGLKAISSSENHNNYPVRTRSFWTNGWTIAVGSGIILAILGFIANYLFG